MEPLKAKAWAKRCVMALLVVFLLAVLALPLWFAYWHTPALPKVETIPEQSVVLALGFWHLGENENGEIRPGDANQHLADWLERHARFIRVVVTQRAIAVALADPHRLRTGAPVLQMHRHDPARPVRTLEALKFALGRFKKLPRRVVLLAHDKHIERALRDLQAVAPYLEIDVPGLGPVPYQDSSRLNPLTWACYELYLARPADLLRRRLSARSAAESSLPQVDLEALRAVPPGE